MFNYISKCFSRITKRDSREIKLLMLGIDNAGKSTIINDLKGEAKELTVPTVGFSNADFKLLNFKVTAYDVGGGPRIRGIWKDYYAEIFGAVYVIDASDRERITESRTVLREAFSDVRLAGKPFVVFANKQDIDGALSGEDVEVQFELQHLARKCGSQYKVFQCTALLNGGKKVDSQLKKGLSWLLQTMNEDFPSLQERVLKDIEVQKEADKKERAERLERMRKYREEREKAEREKEAAKNEENVDSDDEDVVFGNVLPRVKDLSKIKTKVKTDTPAKEIESDSIGTNPDEQLGSKNNMDIEENSPTISEEPLSESSKQINEIESGVEAKRKKRKKKRKAKRNQTVPSDEGENSDAGVILKPISAWKTPPPSLNGFPGNGRKLEPIRAPLHNNLYSPSNVSLVSEENDMYQFNNGHIRSFRPRPNEEDCDVMT